MFDLSVAIQNFNRTANSMSESQAVYFERRVPAARLPLGRKNRSGLYLPVSFGAQVPGQDRIDPGSA